MNGKDLLAVLAMIAPGVLLGFVVVLSLLPKGATQSVALRENPAAAAPQKATQKRMRDPWGKPPYSKSASTL